MQEVMATPVLDTIPDGIRANGPHMTKRRRHILAALSVSFFLLSPLFVFAQGQEHVGDYKANITIGNDSSITVLETISYNFVDGTHHGIFRDIPVNYQTDLGNRSIRVSVASVSRDGYPEPYTVGTSGNTMEIKIGDPQKTVSAGQHVYRITYTVLNAFNSFSDADELYWNAIPDGFAVPIDAAHVSVTAPVAPKRTSCFKGTQGSRTQCAATVNGTTVTADAVNLSPHEGVTVAVALPKGAVTLPSAQEKLWWWLTDNYIVFLPLLVLLVMWRIWYAKGRDAKGRGTIVPEYEPPLDLTPVFMGSVVDGRLDNRDITAGLLYLAEQGHITITREEKRELFFKHTDYSIAWLGDSVGIDKIDRLVGRIFFGEKLVAGNSVLLSDLHKDTGVAGRKRELQAYVDAELQRKGYFANKPQQTKRLWLGVAFAFAVGLPFIQSSIPVIVASVLSGAIIAAFGFTMPKRTKIGAEMREKILGFKAFLSVTQKERLDFENAPERSPKQFMEYLPHAVALGVERKWGEQFKDIYIEKPSWYRGGQFNNYAAAAFVGDFSDFTGALHTSMQGAAAGASGTGGGGFAGGGFGGGGGGSW